MQCDPKPGLNHLQSSSIPGAGGDTQVAGDVGLRCSSSLYHLQPATAPRRASPASMLLGGCSDSLFPLQSTPTPRGADGVRRMEVGVGFGSSYHLLPGVASGAKEVAGGMGVGCPGSPYHPLSAPTRPKGASPARTTAGGVRVGSSGSPFRPKSTPTPSVAAGARKAAAGVGVGCTGSLYHLQFNRKTETWAWRKM